MGGVPLPTLVMSILANFQYKDCNLYFDPIPKLHSHKFVELIKNISYFAKVEQLFI